MPDGRASDPWCLCTVDQVEELKALIKVIPIWSTVNAGVSERSSKTLFLLLRASTMNRHITSKFEIPRWIILCIPRCSLRQYGLLSTIAVIIPLASKKSGENQHASAYNKKNRTWDSGLRRFHGKIGAIIERVRRETAIVEGISDNPRRCHAHVPQCGYCHFISYLDFSEAMNGVGLEKIKRVGFQATSTRAIMITITGLLATLGFATFIYYLACSKAYGPCKGGQGGIAGDVREGSADDDDDVDDGYSSLS
ncbi:PROTEIN NRT1/ PTR FAMILY 1.3 [Salix viminalis]|uniref:PROTEIN NRT1/ PTR FAMILY 1.3 n=1 Tax=Salix viminalis TaxID=40686 RepID=A0A9Q0NQR6_SALVM|nr:PROTEIN NRT1/ PTR FAMILY 1.3 [Salix viminalis]